MNSDDLWCSVPLVTDIKLKAYFYGHTELVQGSHRGAFYQITKPLHVFKKVYGARGEALVFADGNMIANLIIPVGAVVYVDHTAWTSGHRDGRKMRASSAHVHSIVRIQDRHQVQMATSGFSKTFAYTVGETVTPDRPFSGLFSQCESGIHFFLNLDDALSYV